MSELNRTSFDIRNRLYHYGHNGVEFDPESAKGTWCGIRSRQCNNCRYTSSSEPWNWCSTRLMSHRLALRLRKLASLSKQESMTIRVIRAFLEDTNGMDQAERVSYSPLFKEGRGIRFTSTSGSANLGRLASLALCAGFDYVVYRNASYLDAFVGLQEPFSARIATYPKSRAMIAVPINNLDGQEYMPYDMYANKSGVPLLLDGHNADKHLSEKYKVSEVLSPGSRYFRFDTALLECLELASDDFGRKIEIVLGSAYRTRTANLDNIDDRHPDEKYRYQKGQAVEVYVPGLSQANDIVNIGKSIIRACPDTTRPLQLVIGIGCYKDKLYLDIRPMTSENEQRYIKLWDSGGSKVYLGLLPFVFSALTGGTVISPFDKTTSCSSPTVDKNHRYLSFQLEQPILCSGTHQRSFCSQTEKHREEEAHLLQERLSSAAGSDNLPRRDIIGEIKACVVGPCGGCTGSGSVWDNKVRLCARMVHKYIERSSRPFQKLHNRVAFFNTENAESTVHSLACHLGSVCVENIQIYSLLMPLVTARYRPDSDKSVEEHLFTPEDNPTPLLELVSQELAIRASGIVKVYVDTDRDVAILRNILKVLMVFNKNVTRVEFHVTDNVDEDMVRFTIQRKVALWSSTTCSDWSRFAITPYTVHSISNHRRKRSARRSIPRNFAKMAIRDYEFEWLSKMI